jgi:hypothetical protein
VARTQWAAPTDRRAGAILLMLIATVPSVLAINAVRSREAENAPRVIRSNGEISRATGTSDLIPVRAGTIRWVGSPQPDHPPGELRWNGRRLDVRVADVALGLSITPDESSLLFTQLDGSGADLMLIEGFSAAR